MSNIVKALKSGNCQDQQKGSQERHTGAGKIQYVVEEDCGGFEEKTVLAGEGEQAGDSGDEDIPGRITPQACCGRRQESPVYIKRHQES